MTWSAWLMLGITWGVVFFFALRFFLKVVTTTPGDEDE